MIVVNYRLSSQLTFMVVIELLENKHVLVGSVERSIIAVRLFLLMLRTLLHTLNAGLLVLSVFYKNLVALLLYLVEEFLSVTANLG